MATGTAFSVNFPSVPHEYDPVFMRELINFLEELARSTYRRNQHVEIFLQTDSGGREQFLILHSPDGTRWKIEVDNAGTIGATDIGTLGL